MASNKEITIAEFRQEFIKHVDEVFIQWYKDRQKKYGVDQGWPNKMTYESWFQSCYNKL